MAKPAYVWDGNAWITIAPAVVNPYPSQTGNSGKFLTTDGLNVTWATVNALPTQTGNSGKYLTTDGSQASWTTLDLSNYVSKSGGDLITASGSSVIPLTIRGASGQSSFLQVWESSNGTDLVTISSSGAISTSSSVTALSITATGVDAVINTPKLNITAADTSGTSSHYFVETGSDGFVRPKTLANVRTEIVTTTSVNAAAATTLGTVSSGVWEASTISSIYLDPDLARLASPTFTGVPTAPTPPTGNNSTRIATTEFVQKTLEITQLDTFTFDGRTRRFIHTYLVQPVEIDHALRLLLNINGIIQIVAEKPSTVWLSGIASYGYYIDDGYIVLPEPPEAGSYFEARLFPGVDLQKRPDTYPFRAIDIYLGD